MSDEKTDEKPGEEVKSDGSITVLNVLSKITDNLETYQGRDVAICIVHYVGLIIADLLAFFSFAEHLSQKFVDIHNTLANTRVCLRLFDDCNAIREFYRFHKANKVFNNNFQTMKH
jgi:hypothetical protein